MYFVKPSMFEFEPNKIANVTQSGDVSKELARTIARYERQRLEGLLGASLTKELFDSFELTTVANVKAWRLKDDATDPIKNLVNGYTYTPTEPDNNELSQFWSVYGAILGWGYCGCSNSNTEPVELVWKGFVVSNPLLIGQAESVDETCFLTDGIYYDHLYETRTITTGSGQQTLTPENATPASNFSKRIDAYNRFVDSVLGKKGDVSLYKFLHDNKDDYPTWKPDCDLRYKDKY